MIDSVKAASRLSGFSGFGGVLYQGKNSNSHGTLIFLRSTAHIFDFFIFCHPMIWLFVSKGGATTWRKRGAKTSVKWCRWSFPNLNRTCKPHPWGARRRHLTLCNSPLFLSVSSLPTTSTSKLDMQIASDVESFLNGSVNDVHCPKFNCEEQEPGEWLFNDNGN